MAKGQWTIKCMVCGKEKLGPPHGTTCLDCLATGYKWCSQCDNIKPTHDFHTRTDSNGLMSSCITCYSTKRRLDQANRIQNEAGFKEKRNKASLECKQRIASTAEGRARNVMYSQNRRSNLRGSYTVQEWQECLEDFDYSCAYCGTKHNLTVDHIVAISDDGWNYIFNIVPACGSCNSSKGATEVVKWYTSQPFYNEDRLRKIHKRYRLKQEELLRSVRGGDEQ